MSLASGVLVPVILFIAVSLSDFIPKSEWFEKFVEILILSTSGFGFFCGIYSLIIGKLERLIEIVCAVLGISFSGLWFLWFIGWWFIHGF